MVGMDGFLRGLASSKEKSSREKKSGVNFGGSIVLIQYLIIMVRTIQI